MAQQYQIISTQGGKLEKVLSQLVKDVDAQLQKGWKTTGGVSLISEFSYYTAIQALTKD